MTPQARLYSRRKLVLLGVGSSCQRARLLEWGFGDALGERLEIAELAARVARVHASLKSIDRTLQVGELVLDLFYRDARQGERWLGLHPREFALLWRLAEMRGRSLSRTELLRDVWRLNHVPETNSLAVHVSRLRSKLAAHGFPDLVVTVPSGGYRLAQESAFQFGCETGNHGELDQYLRESALSPIVHFQ